MANIVLKDVNGDKQTYQNVSSIILKDDQNENVEFVEKQEDSGGKYLVQVIDYDGTVLKSDHLNTGVTFTLPEAPTNHERLVFQKWSSPVTISDNTITVENSDITIGATYKTSSGLTEIDITLTKVTGLDVVCNMVGNKNWGDGTTDSATTHTYTDYGSYTITCDGISIPAGSSSVGGMFSSSRTSRNYYCTEIRVGDSVTGIGDNAFTYCSSLTSVTILDSITSIGNNAFASCSSIIKYDFTSATSIPAISSTNAFTNINDICKIYVPDALYDDWIVATNWATYADYIYKASEMED